MKAVKVLWEKVREDLNLQAAIFCKVEQVDSQIFVRAVSALELDIALFNGNNNFALRDVVERCLRVPKAVHEHSIKNFALCNLVGRAKGKLHAANIAICAKVGSDGNYDIFLGFPIDNKKSRDNLVRAKSVCAMFSELIKIQESDRKNAERLNVMEKYVREVGHDFAQNIQAVVSKLSLLTNEDNLSGSVAKRLTRESMVEVKSAYAIANRLGVAVDRSFELGKLSSVPLNELFKNLKTELIAEAASSGLDIKYQDSKGINLLIDEQSFHLAMTNILINSIKYSYSDTVIDIYYKVSDGNLIISVKNQGIGLPKGAHRDMIFDFGWRSTMAKKRNVNGSGIGLYSCKKVVLAHEALIWFEEYSNSTIFNISLPPCRFRHC